MGHVQLHATESAQGVDVFVHCQQHLDAYEAEDDAEAVFQIAEVLGDGGQCEVKGA